MSSQEFAAFRWTPQRDEAAVLVAADELTNAQIAAQFGVTRRALDKWIAHPEFKARVEEHRELWRTEIRRRGVADRMRRVEALNDRWQRLRQVIDERAEDMTTNDVPGASTGLLIRQVRMIGTGRNAETVTEYGIDTGLLKELRAHEQQAAQELGQWSEKHEHSGPDGGPIVVDDARERLVARLDALVARRTTDGSDPGVEQS